MLVRLALSFTPLSSVDHKNSSVFRIEFHFGTPLAGFTNHKECRDEQEAIFREWVKTLPAYMEQPLDVEHTMPDGLAMVRHAAAALSRRRLTRCNSTWAATC